MHRRGRDVQRHHRPEAEDRLPREQPGAVDQGAQAAGARQRRPQVRAAQAREAPQGHHGARQVARGGAQGGQGGRDEGPQALPDRGGADQGGRQAEEYHQEGQRAANR